MFKYVADEIHQNENYRIYENGLYKCFFISPIVDGKVIEVKDPLDKKQVFFTIVNKDDERPTISAEISPEGVENEMYAIIGIPFGRSDCFANMHDEKGVWADACRTLIEADELVRKLFPGYHITDKRSY